MPFYQFSVLVSIYPNSFMWLTNQVMNVILPYSTWNFFEHLKNIHDAWIWNTKCNEVFHYVLCSLNKLKCSKKEMSAIENNVFELLCVFPYIDHKTDFCKVFSLAYLYETYLEYQILLSFIYKLQRLQTHTQTNI